MNPRKSQNSASLTAADFLKIEQDETWQNYERTRVRVDPWYWLTNYCWTLDEHDPERPFKRFPNRPYLRELCALWFEQPLLAVSKSRQMMATWLFALLYLGDCQFRRGRLNFFQSKKEEDAAAILDRVEGAWKRQPPWIRVPMHRTRGPHVMKFAENDSRLWAIPQGEDMIRSHTASGVLMDEVAFQDQAEGAYSAAQPSIEGGGRMTLLSSANPGWFCEGLLGNAA